MQFSWFKDRKIIQWGGNVLFFMLIFVIMLDPTNSVLHMKDVFFILLVGYNCLFFKPDFSYLPYILLVYSVILITAVLGDMQGCVCDEVYFMGAIKGFAPLILLLWIPHYDVIRLMKVPVIIVTTLIAILYIAVSSSEIVELFVWNFVKSHNEMIIMTHRSFLGVEIFGMYYKSIISFIFVVFIYFYKLYNEKRWRVWHLLVCCIATFSFLVSGTRSSMLLPFVLLGLVMYRTFMKWKKARYFFYPMLVVMIVAFLMFVFILATEKGEASNEVKYAHLGSYALLFESHPEFLIFGQGPGAIFYSAGFGKWVPQTEWTYIELVRNYGLFALGILLILFKPIFTLLKFRHEEIPFGIMCSYICFLFIAGTNPLLISSTGMIVILGIYSYVDRLEKERSLCSY